MGYAIVDGHLYKDGVKERLEFGNVEQIKFINYINKLSKDGLPLDVDIEKEITINANFKCVCQNHHFWISIGGDDYSDESELIGEQVICPKCKTKYEVSENEYMDIVVLIKK